MHCRPKSQRCWQQVRRCEYRTYKTLCENVPIKTCDPKPVKECKEKCGTFYYCDNCPSVVGPPSPPPAGTFIVGPPAPPLSRTPRKTSKDVRRRQIPRGPLEMQTPWRKPYCPNKHLNWIFTFATCYPGKPLFSCKGRRRWDFFSVKVKTHAGDTASLNVRTKRVTTIPREIVRLSSMSIWYLQLHKRYRMYLVTSAKNRRATVRWR